MNIQSLYIFIFLNILRLGLSAGEFSDPVLKKPSIHFLSLRRNEGPTIGERASYTTVEAFSFPHNYQNFSPFIDLRLHGFGESNLYAANAGLGFRFAPNPKDILGVNVYYDYRNSHNRPFNQIGVGFEMLGSWLNVRVNGYLPVGKQSRLYSSKYWARYTRGYYIKLQKFGDCLKGFDFEAELFGATIRNTGIFLAIGGYYYERKHGGKNILGSEYRFTVKPQGYFSFSVTATRDYYYKTRVQGEITFTIPFNRKEDSQVNSALFQPIQRREIIVLDKHDMYLWNW